jgi:hypothetical protein
MCLEMVPTEELAKGVQRGKEWCAQGEPLCDCWWYMVWFGSFLARVAAVYRRIGSVPAMQAARSVSTVVCCCKQISPTTSFAFQKAHQAWKGRRRHLSWKEKGNGTAPTSIQSVQHCWCRGLALGGGGPSGWREGRVSNGRGVHPC